jgi:hypothetical protein
MKTKTLKLVTYRTVRETAYHDVVVPDNLEGDDLMSVLYQLEIDGLLEDEDVESNEVSSSATYYDADGVTSKKSLEEIDGLSVTFNEDGSISVSNDDPDNSGTMTYGLPDVEPVFSDPVTGVIK